MYYLPQRSCAERDAKMSQRNVSFERITTKNIKQNKKKTIIIREQQTQIHSR